VGLPARALRDGDTGGAQRDAQQFEPEEDPLVQAAGRVLVPGGAQHQQGDGARDRHGKQQAGAAVRLGEMSGRLTGRDYDDYRRSDAAALRLLRRGPAAVGQLGTVLGVTRQAARKVADGLQQRGYANTLNPTGPKINSAKGQVHDHEGFIALSHH
jgi:hypothetical protein